MFSRVVVYTMMEILIYDPKRINYTQKALFSVCIPFFSQNFTIRCL